MIRAMTYAIAAEGAIVAVIFVFALTHDHHPDSFSFNNLGFIGCRGEVPTVSNFLIDSGGQDFSDIDLDTLGMIGEGACRYLPENSPAPHKRSPSGLRATGRRTMRNEAH